MKRINLNDAIGKIDDKIIEKAIETDTIFKLNELKMIEKKSKKEKLVKYFSLFASSLAVIILGVFMINNIKYNNDIQIPNPIVSIDSLEELSKYLGIETDKFDFKEIENINKFNSEILGEITYRDNSVLRISKGNNDNSGIYGSTLKEETTINNTKVKIYSFEKLEYATWQKGGYSYSYRKSSSENITEIVKKLIGE